MTFVPSGSPTAFRRFDHKEARIFDQSEFTLVKVVCNLRNYFGMDLERTIKLITTLFNPKLDDPWSKEAISLAWELVEDFTPWLGLVDTDALAKQREQEIQDEVMELLFYARPGGRVEINTLLAVLNAWNPDLHVTKKEQGHAIRMTTEIESGPSRGKSYFSGFHLPTAKELLDAPDTPRFSPDQIRAMEAGLALLKLYYTTGLPEDWGLEFSACFIKSLQTRGLGHSSYQPYPLQGVAS